jgi:hypothetical protein
MNVLEVAIKNLAAKKEQLEQHVSGGGATDFESYSALVGEIKGLKYAINELKDTNDKLKDDDE